MYKFGIHIPQYFSERTVTSWDKWFAVEYYPDLKIGDKVKIIADDDNGGRLGEIASIANIDKDGPLYLLDGGHKWYSRDSLELIPKRKKILLELEYDDDNLTLINNVDNIRRILKETFSEAKNLTVKKLMPPDRRTKSDILMEFAREIGAVIHRIAADPLTCDDIKGEPEL